jgi:hypothetical protein
MTYANLGYNGDSQLTRDPRTAARPPPPTPMQPTSRIYDRWLMTRFSIAFVALCVFALTNMLVQLNGISNAGKDVSRSSPDFSVDRAKATTATSFVGPPPSYLLFIIFGTTKPFLRHMYTTFVPKRWQRVSKSPVRSAHSLSTKPSQPSTFRSHSVVISSASAAHFQDVEMGLNKKKSHEEDDDDWPMLPLMRPTYSPIGK